MHHFFTHAVITFFGFTRPPNLRGLVCRRFGFCGPPLASDFVSRGLGMRSVSSTNIFQFGRAWRRTNTLSRGCVFRMQVERYRIDTHLGCYRFEHPVRFVSEAALFCLFILSQLSSCHSIKCNSIRVRTAGNSLAKIIYTII